MEPKRLYKNRQQQMICGVCAGFADYLNIDVTLVRLLMVVFGFSGAGLFFYILAAIVMPDRPQW